MATHNLTLNIYGNAAGATNALSRLTAALGSMNRTMAQSQSNAQNMSGSFGGLAVKLAALGVAYKTMSGAMNASAGMASIFEEYEYSLERARAVLVASGEYTAESFAKVTNEVRRLGATTMFHARDAADGLLYLSQAGYSAEESVASLGTALNLAQAGNLSLEKSTSILVATIAQFGGNAAEASRYADVLAAAASASLADVDSLAEGMKYAGVYAGQLGLDVEETAAALAVLSQRNLSNTLGGAALDRFFVELSSAVRPAVRRLTALKSALSFDKLDLRNNTLQEVLQNMKDAGVTGKDLFSVMEARGARAGSILLSSLDDTEAGLKSFDKTIRNSAGVTDTMSGIIGGTWKAVSHKVKSAWEEMNLTLGETMMPWIKAQANSLSTALLGIAHTFKIVKAATAQGEGWDAAMTTLRLAGVKTINYLLGYGLKSAEVIGAAFNAMFTTLANTTDFFKNIGSGAFMLIASIGTALTSTLLSAAATFIGRMKAAIEGLTVKGLLGDAWDRMGWDAQKVGARALIATLPVAGSPRETEADKNKRATWQNIIDTPFQSAAQAALAAGNRTPLQMKAEMYAEQYRAGIAGSWMDTAKEEANAAFGHFSDAMTDLSRGVSGENIKKAWGQVGESLKAVANTKLVDDTQVQSEFDALWNKYKEVIPMATASTLKLPNKLKPDATDTEADGLAAGAGAGNRGPNVVADSMQAIGGGGGFFAPQIDLATTMASVDATMTEIATLVTQGVDGILSLAPLMPIADLGPLPVPKENAIMKGLNEWMLNPVTESNTLLGSIDASLQKMLDKNTGIAEIDVTY